MNKLTTKIPREIDWDTQQFNGHPFFLSSAAVLSGFDRLPWNESCKHFLSISHNKNVKFHYDIADYETSYRSCTPFRLITI